MDLEKSAPVLYDQINSHPVRRSNRHIKPVIRLDYEGGGEGGCHISMNYNIHL